MPQEDYYSKWMNQIQQPKSVPKTTNLYSKWMEQVQPQAPQRTTWQQELPSAISETFMGHIKREKFPEMVTSKYWKRTYGNVKQAIQDIADLTGFTMTPETREKLKAKVEGRSLKSVMVPEKKGLSPEAVEEIVMTYLGKPPKAIEKAMGLITWLPEMGIKFLSKPVETIRDDPVGTAFLFMAASPKVRNLVKKKAKAGKPLSVHEVMKSIPDNVIGKRAKQTVLGGVPPDYAIDIGRLIERPMPKIPIKKAPWQMTQKEFKKPYPQEQKGYDILYTVTDTINLPSIEKNGLLISKATGKEGPKETIFATTKPTGYSKERGLVAFRVKKGDPGVRVESADFRIIVKDIKPEDIVKTYKEAKLPGSAAIKDKVREDVFRAEWGELAHEEIIKQALKEGKPVPREVLAEYPDLKAPPTISDLSPAQKIINALEPAKVIRKQQEALYTTVRGERFPKALEALEKVRGRKGFEAAKGELKGEMGKVQFEPIVQKLSQADVESLFNQIIDSPAVKGIEKLPAGTGLTKLLGEKGGVIPTANELRLLRDVFGGEFVKTVMSKRSTWDKIKGGMLEGANVPRALMASYDLSFGLRQGIFVAARYPKEFASSFLKQFKLFGSDKAFKALKEDISSRPTYKLMKRGGKQKELALTDIDAALSLREEAMMGAAWAEKIPIVGRGVRASNRAYTGYANKLRADVFDHLIKSAEKTGRNPWKEPQLVDSIIDFVNAGTGRGSLKGLENAAVALNATLFSPRLMSSRLSLLNPKFYYKLDPFVRKQALQSLFAFAGMTATILGTAKLAGLGVETNWYSADFAKIKIGNTRIDIMGGFQQYIRAAFQLAGGKVVSTTSGKVTELGKGYKPLTRLGLAGRTMEYKLAPVASFAVNLLRGQSTFGEPLNIPEEVGKRFVPMVMQDVIDLSREDPELLPLATFGFFGMGLQSYGARKKGYYER